MTPDSAPQFIGRAARRRSITTVLVLVDFAALLLATLLATVLRFNSLFTRVVFESGLGDVEYHLVGLVAVTIWMLSFYREGLYDLERLDWGSGQLSRVAGGVGLGAVGLVIASFALKMPGLSRAWFLLSVGLAILLVSLGRLLVIAWLRGRRRNRHLLRRTLVVGNNSEALTIIKQLMANSSNGLWPVGILAATWRESVLGGEDWPVPVLGSAREVRQVVEEHEIDTVVVVSSAFPHVVTSRIIAELRGVDVSINISSGLFEILTTRVLVREVAGVPLVVVRGVPLTPAALRTKRVFDIVLASLVILVGLPLWLVLMLAIWLDSPGPMFYRQRRVGQHGHEFDMLKFRSMAVDADERLKDLAAHNEATGPLFKMKNDPRVTLVGKWMRKFSVDEFPQLLNVLKGDMSLVGPRPPLPREVEAWTDEAWRRMEVPPGMTGLWQISGRSALSFEEMIRLDLYYMENWSVGFDLSLLIRTIPAVLIGKGAW